MLLPVKTVKGRSHKGVCVLFLASLCTALAENVRICREAHSQQFAKYFDAARLIPKAREHILFWSLIQPHPDCGVGWDNALPMLP